jgi:uncharacterized lipoprotein YmbA
MRFHCTAALIAVAFATLASGCVRPTRERLVVLSSSTAAAVVARDGSATIALGRVGVPEYLDGYDIIARTSPHELQRTAGSRWAERLPDAAGRVLRDALAENGVRVVDDAPNAVSIEITAFEANAAGVVVLSAAWEVLDDERQRLADDTSVTEQPAEAGAAGQAAAMELALQRLAADIATTIKGLSATRAAAEGD